MVQRVKQKTFPLTLHFRIWPRSVKH